VFSCADTTRFNTTREEKKAQSAQRTAVGVGLATREEVGESLHIAMGPAALVETNSERLEKKNLIRASFILLCLPPLSPPRLSPFSTPFSPLRPRGAAVCGPLLGNDEANSFFLSFVLVRP